MSKVVVVGATGLVGQKIIECLERRNFPVSDLKLLASERSDGKTMIFKGQPIKVRRLQAEEFDGFDYALFAAGGPVSARYVPIATGKGVRCIDNSSYFRMHPEVPLVVPEVNGGVIKAEDMLIANPNCSTMQCMGVLHQLRSYGLKRVVYTTYQAVSGSGWPGLADLEKGRQDFYPYPIQGNILPHIDDFLETGYTKEEMKMINESRKILNLPTLRVTATAARVPVRFGHCVAINVELDQDFEISDIKALMDQADLGLELVDAPELSRYPMPIEAEGKETVMVGRIRRDESVDFGLNLWTVSDNTLKGAGLNAVQIVEYLERKGFI